MSENIKYTGESVNDQQQEVLDTELTEQVLDTELTEQVSAKKKGRAPKNASTVDSDTPEPSEEKASDSVYLGIFKLHDAAVIPEFKTEESACFDLSAVLLTNDQVKVVTHGQAVTVRRVTDKGIAIHQGERILVPTGLAFDIPQGYCLEIYPRSGISFNRGISLNNCTAIIDSDYVEEVFISVSNNGGSQYIQHGERIAQAKLVKLVSTEVKVLAEKPQQKTSRKSGFGSTGKF